MVSRLLVIYSSLKQVQKVRNVEYQPDSLCFKQIN